MDRQAVEVLVDDREEAAERFLELVREKRTFPRAAGGEGVRLSRNGGRRVAGDNHYDRRGREGVGTTIPVSRRTRDLLARLKGERTWDEFLLELTEERWKKRAEEALRELRKIEFDSSYKEVREIRLRGSS